MSYKIPTTSYRFPVWTIPPRWKVPLVWSNLFPDNVVWPTVSVNDQNHPALTRCQGPVRPSLGDSVCIRCQSPTNKSVYLPHPRDHVCPPIHHRHNPPGVVVCPVPSGLRHPLSIVSLCPVVTNCRTSDTSSLRTSSGKVIVTRV